MEHIVDLLLKPFLTKVLRSEDDGPNSEESGDEGAEMPGTGQMADDFPLMPGIESWGFIVTAKAHAVID